MHREERPDHHLRFEDAMPDRIEPLTAQQCLELLPTVRIGRVIFIEAALPAVRPVAFRMQRHRVVVRVDGEANLGPITGGTVIAFEADDLDPDLLAGWTVTVVGRAHLIDEANDLVELARGPGERCVGIAVQRVTGLRLSRANGAGMLPHGTGDSRAQAGSN